jgi:hypothetical protein
VLHGEVAPQRVLDGDLADLARLAGRELAEEYLDHGVALSRNSPRLW